MADRPDRLFVAVPMPPEPVEAITELVDRVRQGPLGRVPRWVHLPGLHLTVRFLGETPAAQVPAVTEAVAAAMGDHPAFEVVIAGAGSFPPVGKPRALWLGLERGADELGRLAADLGPALEPLGWPPDTRPYRAHVTVARLDASSRADGAAVADALVAAAAGLRTAFTAERVVLYRSRLGGGPPRHEPLVEVVLRS